jgi:hypothetical protein
MLLTITQLAGRLDVSEKTARAIAKDLTRIRVGKRFRYDSVEVDRRMAADAPKPDTTRA